MNNDLISRSALLDLFDAKAFSALELYDEGVAREIWLEAFEAVKNAPSVDAEPVWHAKWHYMRVARYNMPIDCRIRCASCGAIFARLDGMDYRYCPNCGAKMDGD